MHSLKTVGKWFMGTTVLGQVHAGCNFLAKTIKAVKCIGQKKKKKNPKNRHHFLQKPKTKDQSGEHPKTAQDTKPENPKFLSAKTEKPNH